MPKAPSIFSTRDPKVSYQTCDGVKCGHTGLVYAVDPDGTIHTLETSSDLANTATKSNLKSYTRQQYDNGLWLFAYVGS